MSALEPQVQATRYTVTCMPEDAAPDAHLWALCVELGRDGNWAVTDRHDYFSADGKRHGTRFEAGAYAFEVAMAIAKVMAPRICVNGLTPAAALARIERMKEASQ